MPGFIEDFDSDDKAPESEGSYDFDWSGLFESMGEPDGEAEPSDFAPLALALNRIFKWFVNVDLGRKNAEEYIGRRVIVLAWVINPAYFEGNPSLTSIAKSLGLTPQLLHSLSGEVAREFGISNKAQNHAWNRKTE